jgi:hypothetical protein
MYGNAPADAFSFSVDGDGAGVHGSALRVTDAAGLLAPGSMTPSFKDTSGGGGIRGSWDGTYLLPANQGLLVDGFFHYRRDDITLGAFAGLAQAGSITTDDYTLGLSALYRLDTAYLQGAASFDFGNGNETLAADGSTGSFNTHGYSTDLTAGNIFLLFNSIGPANSPPPTGAPPKPVDGFALALDLSGHIGYNDSRVGSFTDSTGFMFGMGQTHSGDVGGHAKLFAVVPGDGLLWMPYVAGTVDQRFGFSTTLNIPNQAALPGGDVLRLRAANTFGGGELGLDVRFASGWTVGAKGFYTASSDTSIAGGQAYVKIPLGFFALAKY